MDNFGLLYQNDYKGKIYFRGNSRAVEDRAIKYNLAAMK